MNQQTLTALGSRLEGTASNLPGPPLAKAGLPAAAPPASSAFEVASNDHLKRMFATGIIVLFLSLQGAATFAFIDKLLWPFMDYPMYSWPRKEGDTIDRFHLFGILEDSTDVPIRAEDLDLNFWEFLWGPIDAMRKGELASLSTYAQEYQAHHGRRVVGFRLENHAFVMTRTGVKTAQPQVVRTLSVPAVDKAGDATVSQHDTHQ